MKDEIGLLAGAVRVIFCNRKMWMTWRGLEIASWSWIENMMAGDWQLLQQFPLGTVVEVLHYFHKANLVAN